MGSHHSQKPAVRNRDEESHYRTLVPRLRFPALAWNATNWMV